MKPYVAAKNRNLGYLYFLQLMQMVLKSIKSMVIGRAAMLVAFRQACKNKDNLPVVYRNNKKAWILSGIWYEYLRDFNTEMAKAKLRIALAMDNCPSHPLVNQPPKGYYYYYFFFCVAARTEPEES